VVDAKFAKIIIHDLSKALSAKRFDRLILIAGPHMLGLLRSYTGNALHGAIVGELPKDLSNQPMDAVESHLGDLIAV
jgi:protein required for attachment to host cells